MSGDPERAFWAGLSKVSVFLNVLVAIAFLLYFGNRTIRYGHEISASDLIVIVLTGVTVVLAALAIVLGALAVWGYSEIKRSAEAIAERVAGQVAAGLARGVADTVARRVAFAASPDIGGDARPSPASMTQGLDALSGALIEEGKGGEPGV